MAVLGLQAHLLDGQADVAAQVLALVQRRDVKIAAVVQRNMRRIAAFVRLEQIKLALAAHVDGQAHGAGALDHALQVAAAVALKGLAVGQGDAAVHAHDAALGGAPGQHGGGVRVGPEDEVALLDVHEPGDGRAVEADALLERAGQLAGKQRDVFLVAEDVAERQLDELDVVILDKIEDVLCGTFHGEPPWIKAPLLALCATSPVSGESVLKGSQLEADILERPTGLGRAFRAGVRNRKRRMA